MLYPFVIRLFPILGLWFRKPIAAGRCIGRSFPDPGLDPSNDPILRTGPTITSKSASRTKRFTKPIFS